MREYITAVTLKSQIAIVTLDRPSALNALSVDLLKELKDVLNAFNNNPKILCTIITGSGEKAFCAGADLKERFEMDKPEVIATVKLIGDVVTQIQNMRMPVIAALNGVAFGGGLEIALACDIRIIENHARVGLTETSLGIIPGAGGTQRLSRLVGEAQAKYMIFTAQPIQANRAFEIGLVQEITESGESLIKSVEIAKRIEMNGPIAVQLAKSAINKGLDDSLHNGIEIEHEHYLKTLDTEDRIEGLQAFKEKRKPNYIGN